MAVYGIVVEYISSDSLEPDATTPYGLFIQQAIISEGV
jgi:hypothetical protein